MPLNDITSCRIKIGNLPGSLSSSILPRLALALWVMTMQPAMANNRPYPADYLSINSFLLVPMVLLLTWAGGAYPILRQKQAQQSKRLLIALKVIVALAAIPLYFAAMMMLPLIVIPVFWWATARAVDMIFWAMKKKQKGGAAPEFLKQANPIRLMIAGTCLMAAMTWILSDYTWHQHHDAGFKQSWEQVRKQLDQLNQYETGERVH